MPISRPQKETLLVGRVSEKEYMRGESVTPCGEWGSDVRAANSAMPTPRRCIGRQ